MQIHESDASRTCEDSEDGRVRQWSNQRLHENSRIPPFSVEVAMRRIAWAEGDAAG